MYEQNQQVNEQRRPSMLSATSLTAQPTKPPRKEIESQTWASPIEIETKKAQDVDLGALNLSQLWNKYATSRLVNMGTRISIGLTGHTYMEAPFLREKYKFVDLSFHYNVDNSNGSEHIIDDKRYAMEAHFLFAHTYTIDITRNLLEAYKLYDDFRTGRTTIPEAEEASVLDYKPTRRTSPSPSAVTFFMDNATDEPVTAPSSTSVGRGANEDTELTPLEKQKKKLDNVEQDVFIERWNRERSSRAVKARKPTAYPRGALSSASLLKMQEASQVKFDKPKVEGAKSALDRRLVKKYETRAKRIAEKRAHDLASKEYPPWRRRQTNLSDLNKDQSTLSAGAPFTESQATVDTGDSSPRISLPRIIPFKETEKNKPELQKIQLKTISTYCCIAVQFELDETAPKYNLFSFLSTVKEPFKEVLIDGNLLVDFEEPLNSTEYYVYHGSLTVPPYLTGVQWVLMKNPLKISSKQMTALRSVKHHAGGTMESHFLGVQAWDNRKIWANKPREAEPTCICPGKDKCMC